MDRLREKHDSAERKLKEQIERLQREVTQGVYTEYNIIGGSGAPNPNNISVHSHSESQPYKSAPGEKGGIYSLETATKGGSGGIQSLQSRNHSNTHHSMSLSQSNKTTHNQT